MDWSEWVKDDETIEDLNTDGLRIIQKTNGFRFGIDSVLLADFTSLRKNDRILDLGTGTGIIPLLLSAKMEGGSITAIEILPDMAEMASRSVRLNNLENRIDIVRGDLRECTSYFKAGEFDVVTVNPPYMNAGGGILSPHDSRAIARHEIKCTLEDVVKAASVMLRHLGSFNMVHRPERLADVICIMRKYRLEPKKLKFVHSDESKKPSMILVNGMKGSNPQLNILPPLFLRREG
jgi:tRNA1Val (adenine37-N6)-methyltransferase